MKWVILLNLFAAFAFLALGSTAKGIHRVHSYSMYREFVAKDVVDAQKVKTLAQSDEHYDVVKRMQQIGNAESWFSEISSLAALACILNAVAIYFISKKTAR